MDFGGERGAGAGDGVSERGGGEGLVGEGGFGGGEAHGAVGEGGRAQADILYPALFTFGYERDAGEGDL